METYRKDRICNICKKESPSKLSYDHIPPKGGVNITDMLIGNYNNFSAEFELPKQTSQNGIKFRTLCRDCNSMLSKYDRPFNDLMNSASYIVKCPFILPKTILLKTYPTRVIKSLLAHLLSAKTGFCDMATDKIIRDFILNRENVLSKNIRIFVWFFPYNITIIKNDLFQIKDGIRVHYSILKSYPLAYAVSFDNKVLCNTTEITSYNTNNDEHEAEIKMYLHTFTPLYPENGTYINAQLTIKDNYGVFGVNKIKNIR